MDLIIFLIKKRWYGGLCFVGLVSTCTTESTHSVGHFWVCFEIKEFTCIVTLSHTTLVYAIVDRADTYEQYYTGDHTFIKCKDHFLGESKRKRE